MTIFTGSAVAIVTPFFEDESIDYKSLESLIEFQIGNGTDAIVIAGTTGESPTLTYKEQYEVIDFTVKKVAGRVPVIAGSGSNSTRHAVEMSIEVEKLGVDALLVITPYYNKTSQKGLLEHFTKVADNINIPIIVYNVPGRTGQVMTPETIYELSKHKNIVGYKDAVGDIVHTLEVRRLCENNIDIYSGNDDINVPIISAGGKGTISVLANIFPQEIHNMCRLALNGEMEEAMNLQLKYNNLIGLLFKEPNPIPIKKCVELLGMGVSYYRLPMTEPSESLVAELSLELNKFRS